MLANLTVLVRMDGTATGADWVLGLNSAVPECINLVSMWDGVLAMICDVIALNA